MDKPNIRIKYEAFIMQWNGKQAFCRGLSDISSGKMLLRTKIEGNTLEECMAAFLKSDRYSQYKSCTVFLPMIKEK